MLLAGSVTLLLLRVHRVLDGGRQLQVWQRADRIDPQPRYAPLPQQQQPEAVQGGQHLHLGGLSVAERAEVMRQLRGGQ
jgi:hypothetical protein